MAGFSPPPRLDCQGITHCGSERSTSIAAANYFTEVLIEYDGPQVIIAQQGNAQFLSLCIDEDESGSRWLEAPLSPLEKTAMLSGALAVRDVLLKHGVVLVEK